MQRPIPLVAIAAMATLTAAEPGHPALQPPDGTSGRGGKMVGNSLSKWEDVEKLGKLYREAKDFETKQAYFLRLLDYFYFSEERVVGMTRAKVEAIFGKGRPDPVRDKKDPDTMRLSWGGGRDSFWVSFKDDKATGAFYVMGF